MECIVDDCAHVWCECCVLTFSDPCVFCRYRLRELVRNSSSTRNAECAAFHMNDTYRFRLSMIENDLSCGFYAEMIAVENER